MQREVNLYPDEFDLAVWECAFRSSQQSQVQKCLKICTVDARKPGVVTEPDNYRVEQTVFEYTWAQNKAFPGGRMLLAYPTVLHLFSW